MTIHTVTEDELSEYVQQQRQDWSTFAISSSAGSLKKLQFCMGALSPCYRVTAGEREIYIGVLPESAVREYNALP